MSASERDREMARNLVDAIPKRVDSPEGLKGWIAPLFAVTKEQFEDRIAAALAQARREGYEEAAKIADKRAALHAAAAAEHQGEGHALASDARVRDQLECEGIAAAIRRAAEEGEK